MHKEVLNNLEGMHRALCLDVTDDTKIILCTAMLHEYRRIYTV